MRRYSTRERVVLGLATVIVMVAASAFYVNRETYSGLQQLTALSTSVLVTAVLLRIVISGETAGSERELSESRRRSWDGRQD